jgi:hypothetical protein
MTTFILTLFCLTGLWVAYRLIGGVILVLIEQWERSDVE